MNGQDGGNSCGFWGAGGLQVQGFRGGSSFEGLEL